MGVSVRHLSAEIDERRSSAVTNISDPEFETVLSSGPDEVRPRNLSHYTDEFLALSQYGSTIYLRYVLRIWILKTK